MRVCEKIQQSGTASMLTARGVVCRRKMTERLRDPKPPIGADPVTRRGTTGFSKKARCTPLTPCCGNGVDAMTRARHVGTGKSLRHNMPASSTQRVRNLVTRRASAFGNHCLLGNPCRSGKLILNDRNGKKDFIPLGLPTMLASRFIGRSAEIRRDVSVDPRIMVWRARLFAPELWQAGTRRRGWVAPIQIVYGQTETSPRHVTTGALVRGFAERP